MARILTFRLISTIVESLTPAACRRSPQLSLLQNHSNAISNQVPRRAPSLLHWQAGRASLTCALLSELLQEWSASRNRFDGCVQTLKGEHDCLILAML